MSLLTRSRTESVEEPQQQPPEPESFHSTEDLTGLTGLTSPAPAGETNLYCLVLHLKAGHDLSIKDSCGTSDPYVKFFHDGKMVYKSKTVYKDLNPFWDEKFEMIIEDVSVPLDIKVS